MLLRSGCEDYTALHNNWHVDPKIDSAARGGTVIIKIDYINVLNFKGTEKAFVANNIDFFFKIAFYRELKSVELKGWHFFFFLGYSRNNIPIHKSITLMLTCGIV